MQVEKKKNMAVLSLLLIFAAVLHQVVSESHEDDSVFIGKSSALIRGRIVLPRQITKPTAGCCETLARVINWQSEEHDHVQLSGGMHLINGTVEIPVRALYRIFSTITVVCGHFDGISQPFVQVIKRQDSAGKTAEVVREVAVGEVCGSPCDRDEKTCDNNDVTYRSHLTVFVELNEGDRVYVEVCPLKNIKNTEHYFVVTV